MQASCDQHVDGSGLAEYVGPTACHGVGEEAPWGTAWVKDRVPTLADPLQGLGDATEDEGAGAVAVRWAGCQQQGHGPARLGAGLLLVQAVPVLLVFQAAEQHLVQRHCEVLLVCGTRRQARHRGGWECGAGKGQAC